MRRRGDGPIVEILVGLTELPLWVSGVVAAVVYLMLAFLPRLFAGQSQTSLMLAKAIPPLAPYAAGLAITAGLIGVVGRWRRGASFSRANDVGSVRSLDWRELEGLVAETYRRQGYVVTERGGHQPDGGIDLELDRNGERVVVQCKQWNRPVGVERVRELLGVVTAGRAGRGVLVAPGGFTRDAVGFAAGTAIELLDAKGLMQLKTISQRLTTTIETSPPSIPAEVAPVCPSCSQPMVLRTARKGPRTGSQFWGCSTYGQTRCPGRREHAA